MPFLLRDIYNLNALFKRQQLRGLSATDALILDLKARGIHYEIRPGEDDRTKHLFIACPESIRLALNNQDVVLIDNTYKTNKFDIPLLHIISK